MIHKAFPAKVFTKVVIGCSWVEDSGFRAWGGWGFMAYGFGVKWC